MKLKMATHIYGINWLPWNSRKPVMDLCYDILWSNVPPPKRDGMGYTVGELQGNLLKAVLQAYDAGVSAGCRGEVPVPEVEV